jgi:hypothetical protein
MKTQFCATACILTAAFSMSTFANAQSAPDAPDSSDSTGWNEWSLSTGAEYTSGSYGDVVDTNILYVPVSAKYENEFFQLKVTVPYLKIDSGGSVIGGVDGGVIIVPGGAAFSESGLGDVIASATFNIYPDRGSDLPYLELTGKAKLPTADETKGLGTGEIDFTAQADIFKSFGNVTPFATIGYKLRGDPDVIDLDNSVLGSAGLSVKSNDSLSFGVVYDYQGSATPLSDDQSEISPFIVVKPTPGVSLNFYGVLGLSDGSPDTGGGVQVKRTF